MTDNNITLADIGLLVNAVNIAQKRGAYTLQEAGVLSKVVLSVSKVLDEYSKKNQDKQENTDTNSKETVENGSKVV